MASKNSRVLKKLNSMDRRLRKIEKEDKRIEKEERKVENELERLDKEEESIEKNLIKIGKINIKKRHFFEIVRASAGAFLGVGLGRGLLGLDNLAKTLPWVNVIGILVFILLISTLLIWKTEKVDLDKKGVKIIFQKLFFIYVISLLIEFLSLLLFKVQFDDISVLIKIMIVGSYTAMASAVSFSLDR